MRTSQNPFSVYDLLAYLIPGLLSILGTSIILSNDFTLGHYTEGFWNVLNIKAFNIENIIPLLIVAYLAGHLLSYISAMIIEKFSIWSISYPTVYLFDKILSNKKEDTNHGSFAFLKNYYSPPEIPNKWIYVLRTIMLIFLMPLIFPLVATSCVFNAHSTIRKPLDRKLAQFVYGKIKSHYKNRGIKLKKKSFGKFEWFRPISHFVYEHYPEHVPKIQNYVALYGFNRNITLMFVLFFWLFGYVEASGSFTDHKIIVLFFLMAFCLIFYAAFNKFYRRFSLEVLMALSANYEVEPHKAKKGLGGFIQLNTN